MSLTRAMLWTSSRLTQMAALFIVFNAKRITGEQGDETRVCLQLRDRPSHQKVVRVLLS